MLRKSPIKILSTLFLCFFIFFSRFFAATGQDFVNLWSNSDCAEDDTLVFIESVVIFLNKTLDANTCGNLLREVYNYRVDRRSICVNGSTARFVYYNNYNYQIKDFNNALNSIDQTSKLTEFDKLCLALVIFASIAFICDSINEENTFSTTIVISTDSSELSSTSSIELLLVNIFTIDLFVVFILSATMSLYIYFSTLASFSAASSETQLASRIFLLKTDKFLSLLLLSSLFIDTASRIKISILSLIFAFEFEVAI